MTDVTDLLDDVNESRRSVMKKGALATGALALGSASIDSATAQDGRVAVFAFKYYPGADFDVVAQLESSTTVEVLQDQGETVPEISQPDEWTGHIIRYDVGEDSGITTLLFTDGQGLEAGASGTLGTDASVLSSQLNLLDTSLDGGGQQNGGGNGDTPTPTPGDGGGGNGGNGGG